MWVYRRKGTVSAKVLGQAFAQCLRKNKEVRVAGVEVEGTGFGYHSEGSGKPSEGSEQKSNLDLEDDALKVLETYYLAHSKCSISISYCYISPLNFCLVTPHMQILTPLKTFQ